MAKADDKITKWGAGHLAAMGRLGFHELQNAVVNPGGNIAAPSEYGLVGTALPSDVQRSMQSQPDVSGERISAVLNRLRESAGKVPERDDREPEKE